MLNKYKELTLEQCKDKLPDDYFTTDIKPKPHQYRSLVAALIETNYLFALDMGGGKTALMLWQISIRKKLGLLKKKVLVITPPNVLSHWASQLSQFTDNLTCHIYSATGANFCGLVSKNNDDIIVVSQSLLPSIFKVAKASNVISDLFDMVVVDEAQFLRNGANKSYKQLYKATRSMKYRYLITGTPIGNNLEGFFWLLKFLDNGTTLGFDYYPFIREYFDVVTLGQSNWTKITIKPTKRESLLTKVSKKMIRYSEDEMSGLPEKVYKKVLVALHLDNEKRYNELKKQNKFDKLLEVCEGPEKATELGYFLKDLHDKHILIFVWHVNAAEALKTSLVVDKPIYVINGATSPKDKVDLLNIWRKEGGILITNVRSLGVGVELKESNVCIFYSNNFSLIDRKQAEKRIHRIGQTKTCYFYDFICVETCDVNLYSALMRYKFQFDTFLDGKDREMITQKALLKEVLGEKAVNNKELVE